MAIPLRATTDGSKETGDEDMKGKNYFSVILKSEREVL